jgi:diguanylate cyclase (GGDEF)-like protein/PAS domain S-box-containing protein
MAALLTSPLVTVIVVVALSVFNFLLIPFAQNQQFSDLVLQDGPFFRFILQTAFIIISAGTILYSTRLVQALVQNLVKSEYRFRALFEKTSDAVFIANMDLCLIEVNEQAARLLAYPREELSGLHIRSLFPEDEWTDVQKRFSAVKTAVALPPTLRRFVTKTGTELVLETNLSLVQDQDGNPLHYQSTGRDVTQKYLEEQRIKSTLVHMAVKASTDALTGILNRETVSQHAEAEWERYDREGQPLSLMLVDMDGLKRINDTHGHNSGDAALNTIARLVEQHKRPYDWFGRYGGDEFLLVLPGTTLRDAQEIARRMRAAVSKERVQVGKKRARLSASFGVASTDGHQPPIRSVSELIKLADVALYKEKRRKQKD